MRSECFLDTNVLIYAAAARAEDPRRHGIARDLIARTAFGLSAQVLAEFYVVASKKFAIELTSAHVDEWIERLSAFPVVPIDAALVRDATAVSRRYEISYWDAAIVVAAAQLEAPILYTEDLNHGQAYGPVTAVNPFRDA